MGCLDNLIGINNVCDIVQSVSGLSVNDLPGMSIKIAESIITNEDISGKKFIEDKIQFSQKYLIADIRNYLQDKFKINSILSSETFGIYKPVPSISTAIAGRLKGIRVLVYEYSYTELQISRIGIKLNSSVTDNIYIYDLSSGKLLDTIEFTSIAGEIVYVDVNKKYKANKQKQSIFVCLDASIADQYDTYSGQRGCLSCSRSNVIEYSTSGYISSASQKIDSNFIASSGSAGITIDYNISCDIERFICSMAQSVAWPLLYKIGAEILKELRFSKNLNSMVLIDRENSEEMLTYYESEYLRGMNQLTTNMRIPDDICFRCDKKIKRTIQIP